MATEEPVALTLKIKGMVYPFPSFDTLSYREAKRIKDETGLVMGQFYEALEKGDPDALLAIAYIAKLRDDPNFEIEELYDLNLADIDIVGPPEAAEEPRPDDPTDESPDGSGDESGDG